MSLVTNEVFYFMFQVITRLRFYFHKGLLDHLLQGFEKQQLTYKDLHNIILIHNNVTWD